jgi:hypothetical protein
MHYDHVIIGSSPVCILESIASNNVGKKSCIIDSNKRLGGAWKTLEMDETQIGNVEIGCHIIEKDKKVFQFFEEQLNLKLEPLDPQPRIIYRNKWLRYNLKNLVFIFSDMPTYFNAKGSGRFKKNIRLFFKELAQFRLKYYSFKNSSSEFAARLEKLVENTTIDTKLESTVKKIHIDTNKKRIELITSKEQTLVTNKLSLTFASNVEQLFIDGKNMSSVFKKSTSEFVHLHILVKDAKLKKFSYLRIVKNEIIHRVSDMSSQAALNPNEFLLCVGVYSGAVEKYSEGEIYFKVLSLLKEMGIASTECVILKKRSNSYKSATTKYAELKVLEKASNNLIEVIYTSDLTLGIRQNLHKYKTIVYSDTNKNHSEELISIPLASN